MNIFYLSQDPSQAAVYHNDRHVVKMILETAQLLSTAHRVLDNSQDTRLYKSTHINHHSSKWARENINNYNWLYELFYNLCNEYTFRYGKTHLTDTKLRELLKTPPANISLKGFTQPSQAMPDQYKDQDSMIAYRNYYKAEKRHLAVWSKRQIPEWYS